MSSSCLIIQHIWTRWSKSSRGANSPIRRIRPEPAYPLPAVLPVGRAICHDIACHEAEGFQIVERCCAIETLAARRQFPGLNRLTWQEHGQVLRLRFDGGRQASNAALDRSRYFVDLSLKIGRSLRIDWNARVPMSIGGGSRASVYEQHVFLIYFGARGGIPDYLGLKHDKIVDLTRAIY